MSIELSYEVSRALSKKFLRIGIVCKLDSLDVVNILENLCNLLIDKGILTEQEIIKNVVEPAVEEWIPNENR